MEATPMATAGGTPSTDEPLDDDGAPLDADGGLCGFDLPIGTPRRAADVCE